MIIVTRHTLVTNLIEGCNKDVCRSVTDVSNEYEALSTMKVLGGGVKLPGKEKGFYSFRNRSPLGVAWLLLRHDGELIYFWSIPWCFQLHHQLMNTEVWQHFVTTRFLTILSPLF